MFHELSAVCQSRPMTGDEALAFRMSIGLAVFGSLTALAV